jgi:hypothetical protein
MNTTNVRTRRAKSGVSYRIGQVGRVLAAVILGGCGSEPRYSLPNRGSSVSGTVTLQGKPLLQGAISFIPPAQSKDATTQDDPGAGAIMALDIKEGRYELTNPPGLAPASYKVEIRSKNIPAEILAQGPDMGVRNPMYHEQIPEKYNGKTTLTAEVAAGDNTINFDLTGPPPPVTVKPRSTAPRIVK